ncbi:ThiF family adenylyltransferase [Desulfoprunum benzoelyticum]|uniref:Molybdopterin/thiamine biosynthesis adenylyltransferase n=1 Tax=Desulfoprunum benzoelyticum TaxID=1506996 RepID=A0A840V3G9_9BACT|nr:ThiF family adenylyltransferase [Desulfoprunum benzoelyticum]MBB5349368.1 molybdopterin/thiamine biosynthesis adenylyltransferase [Desulfoprunum benzoelyticum]MBM9531057.1 ThiF family adenylyltransferase [Desulfoprunum benzoelyticum]
MNRLGDFLRQRAASGTIALADAREAAATFRRPLPEIEEQALHLNIMPLRYLRNGLRCQEQLSLVQARVGIIGCGGLGGTVAALLARLGIGRLRLVDPDCFEEHNLNRQRFATIDSLGRPKTESARRAISSINPAVVVEAVVRPFTEADIEAVDIVVDGLDDAGKRLELAAHCTNLDRPLVHGAVRDWHGQTGVATARNRLIATLYPNVREDSASKPPVNVLAPTVTVIAAIQAAETCKLILGVDSPLGRNWMLCDLLEDVFEHIPA